jgi:hypothetical protein
MSRFEWISLSLQIVTLIAASYFAYAQNAVNEHIARLEDYVSVSAVPENGGIRFLNTGGSNVYIDEIDVNASSRKRNRCPRWRIFSSRSASCLWSRLR